ncbi:MAG TPA: CpaF family protein [Phycisphaerae bacterium]|nr:CpaF family protein [Phycisphaerae bacterium]
MNTRFFNHNNPRRPVEGPADKTTHQIRMAIRQSLLSSMDMSAARKLPMEQLFDECSQRVDRLLTEQSWPLTIAERNQILHEILDDIFGLGPLEQFLRDPTVSDILINGAKTIYVERRGMLEPTDTSFGDDAQLLEVIRRIANSVGRRIDEASPMLDARLSDGSRVNAIIPPLALDGPIMSIRRFGAKPYEIDQLLEMGTLTKEMVLFLQNCVHCKINMLVVGGTGCGKTTMLNVLSRWIPENERVITIEDAAELQLQRQHVVRLESRPPNVEGKGQVTQCDLFRNSLRMRPDRIIVGEVRGAEVLDMMQAMNTGHEGSLTTIHANQPREALNRIESMILMTGLPTTVKAIRQQIAASLNILVQLERLVGGARKMTSISEITGMEGETICIHELFRFQQTGVDEKGCAQGQFEICGVVPRILPKLKERGAMLPADMFKNRVMGKS